MIAATSVPALAFLRSSIADSTAVRSVAEQLVARVLQHPLGRVDHLIGAVARLDLVARFLSSSACDSASFIILSISSLLRPLDAVIVIFCSLPVPRSFADTFTMPLASMSNVTSICGMPRGAGGMPDQMELAERAVVARHRALALQHVHFDAVWLSAAVEKISLLRVGIVVLRSNQLRHHAAQRLDAERQRRDVEQQHVFHFAGEHAGLNRRADRDDFVRVHALVRFLAEEFLDDLLHLRDARRAADEHDFVDLARVDAGIVERLLASGPPCAAADLRPAARTSRASASSPGASARWHRP